MYFFCIEGKHLQKCFPKDFLYQFTIITNFIFFQHSQKMHRRVTFFAALLGQKLKCFFWVEPLKEYVYLSVKHVIKKLISFNQLLRLFLFLYQLPLLIFHRLLLGGLLLQQLLPQILFEFGAGRLHFTFLLLLQSLLVLFYLKMY